MLREDEFVGFRHFIDGRLNYAVMRLSVKSSLSARVHLLDWHDTLWNHRSTILQLLL